MDSEITSMSQPNTFIGDGNMGDPYLRAVELMSCGKNVIFVCDSYQHIEHDFNRCTDLCDSVAQAYTRKAGRRICNQDGGEISFVVLGENVRGRRGKVVFNPQMRQIYDEIQSVLLLEVGYE